MFLSYSAILGKKGKKKRKRPEKFQISNKLLNNPLVKEDIKLSTYDMQLNLFLMGHLLV